ncbi:MAG: dinitrogenase iron-molybdenum cofactor biosynthesis protein [Carboxylicivirga sp.]|jgi:predicted Fe-Mo cluster-binding NifX family protein|nr:dinitrogenase iron-molybdenum cofactor biosynthesis protein [Carboxylicivirga sp.]MCT4645276.1 dinitrogenase iron-molybdenum cofactor biosynthesis protein [Carboxylicivirga sp.]
MNIIITSKGNQLQSEFDLRFGRAAYFCLYNTDNKSTTFIKNENVDAQGGAGTKSAEKVVELEAKRIISGDFGPKAKDLLNKFNIQMVMLDEDHSTIESIIAKLVV